MSTYADEASLEQLYELEKELAAVKAQARDTASELTLAINDAASEAQDAWDAVDALEEQVEAMGAEVNPDNAV